MSMVETASERKTSLSDTALLFFLGARFFGALADQVVLFAVPISVYIGTNSLAMSGLAFFLEWLPRVLCLPFLGLLVDRFPLRRQFIAIDVARFGLTLALTMIGNYVAVMVIAGLLSLFNAYAFVALENVVATQVPRDEIPRNQARLQTLDQVTRVLGPMVGGLLLGLISFAPLMVVAAVLFGLGTLLLFLFFFPSERTDDQRAQRQRAIMHDLAVGFRILFESRVLVRLVILTLLVNLTEGVATAVLPAIIIGRFRQTSEVIGVVQSSAAIASIAMLLALSFVVDRVSLQFIAAVSGLAMILMALLMAGTSSYILFGGGFTCYVVARCCYTTYVRTERLKHIPAQHLGKALGLMIAALLIALPLSGVIVMVFQAIVAPQTIITFTTLASTIIAGLVLLLPILMHSWKRLLSSRAIARLRGDHLSD
jgi:MFS family permease